MARGTRVVVLCPRCDAGDPAACPLILFFAVHGQVTGETAEEFAALLRGWASQAQAPDVDLDVLEAELQAWRRGELDIDEPPPVPCLPGDDRLEWSDQDPDNWP